MPIHQLAATMPVRDFVWHQRDASRRMLPKRRVELYLAQIAFQIALHRGVKDCELRDFLFDPEPEFVDDQAAAIEFFDFKPTMSKSNGAL